nr:predicted GPI-anchored protein 58 [Aegilops tauschii subsp. strangulata]
MSDHGPTVSAAPTTPVVRPSSRVHTRLSQSSPVLSVPLRPPSARRRPAPQLPLQRPPAVAVDPWLAPAYPAIVDPWRLGLQPSRPAARADQPCPAVAAAVGPSGPPHAPPTRMLISAPAPTLRQPPRSPAEEPTSARSRAPSSGAAAARPTQCPPPRARMLANQRTRTPATTR